MMNLTAGKDIFLAHYPNFYTTPPPPHVLHFPLFYIYKLSISKKFRFILANAIIKSLD